MKVVHISSVHPAEDTRIFHKQCVSLAEAEYSVKLIVPAPKSYHKKGVEIVALPPPKGRWRRICITSYKAFRLARRLRADIYHFHDPELLVWGWRLKRSGIAVYYDAHEDVPRQILAKYWIPRLLRQPIAWAFEKFENFIARRLDGVVAATPTIEKRFKEIGAQTVRVCNYPLLSEWRSDRQPARKLQACYVGGLNKHRGLFEMLDLAHSESVSLVLAGRFTPKETENHAREHAGWKHVEFRGFLDRNGISELLAECTVGLVLLHPIANYLDALPVKMFEYMASGLPVLASNFPLWKSILERENCGICVDPMDSTAIANAYQELVSNPERARQMGENGRRAIEQRYNWELEVIKLRDLYRRAKR